MESGSEKTFNILGNPIDEIEEIVSAYELNFSRNHLYELILTHNGIWNNYEVSFNWYQSKSLICINNNLNIKIPKNLVNKLQKMIAIINDNILLGYFGFSVKSNSLYFRYNLSMRGVNNLSTEQIEDFIDIITEECDKYYPAFQIFIHKKKDAEFAIKSALLETLGEA